MSASKQATGLALVTPAVAVSDFANCGFYTCLILQIVHVLAFASLRGFLHFISSAASVSSPENQNYMSSANEPQLIEKHHDFRFIDCLKQGERKRDNTVSGGHCNSDRTRGPNKKVTPKATS
ncbi:hypothetical protein JHK82_043437 [Glycine max]|nr:hypothetical protein JHK82_043437 [Glycine max]